MIGEATSCINLFDRKWKTFDIPSLFDVTAGVYYSDKECCYGTTPYVSSSATNNGIGKWIDRRADFEGNMIVTGKIGCKAFYQKDPFCATSDVNVLIPKFNMNEYIGIFIACTINSNNFKYDYNRQCRQGNMRRMIIQLPVNSKGIPDWQFMENYIKSLKHKTEILDLLKLAGDETPERILWLNNNIDINDFKKFIQSSKQEDKNNLSTTIALKLSDKKWKEFKLTDIFNCGMGNGIDSKNINISKDSNISYVSRTSINNGIVSKVDRIENYEPFLPGNLTLALGGEYLGTCFVQSENFYTAQNVAVLRCKKEVSQRAKQFIATIIRNEAKTKYFAFGRELNSHFKTDFTITLPINSEGEPDYQFMDAFINQIELSLY